MILSLVNYYGDDYGGRKQYIYWARKQNQIIPSDDEFFTNHVVKGFYKNHIKVREIEIERERGSAVSPSN